MNWTKFHYKFWIDRICQLYVKYINVYKYVLSKSVGVSFSQFSQPTLLSLEKRDIIRKIDFSDPYFSESIINYIDSLFHKLRFDYIKNKDIQNFLINEFDVPEIMFMDPKWFRERYYSSEKIEEPNLQLFCNYLKFIRTFFLFTVLSNCVEIKDNRDKIEYSMVIISLNELKRRNKMEYSY
jgi:hypothetical protein